MRSDTTQHSDGNHPFKNMVSERFDTLIKTTKPWYRYLQIIKVWKSLWLRGLLPTIQTWDDEHCARSVEGREQLGFQLLDTNTPLLLHKFRQYFKYNLKSSVCVKNTQSINQSSRAKAKFQHVLCVACYCKCSCAGNTFTDVGLSWACSLSAAAEQRWGRSWTGQTRSSAVYVTWMKAGAYEWKVHYELGPDPTFWNRSTLLPCIYILKSWP